MINIGGYSACLTGEVWQQVSQNYLAKIPLVEDFVDCICEKIECPAFSIFSVFGYIKIEFLRNYHLKFTLKTGCHSVIYVARDPFSNILHGLWTRLGG